MYFEDRHKIGVFKLIKIYLTTLCINEKIFIALNFKIKQTQKRVPFS